MTISVKHTFHSGKSDGPDPTLVQPSNWNDSHDLEMATGKILGRVTATDGVVEELTPTQVSTLLGLGTASTQATGAFATATQGAHADTALTNAATAQTTANTGVTNAAAAQTTANAALPKAGGTVTGNLQVNGTTNSTGHLSENSQRVYSAGNPPPADVYSGTDVNNTNYPIGSYLIGNINSDNRNAAKTMYLGGASNHFTTSVAGTVVAGTWNARGHAGSGSDFTMYQRTS